LAYPPPIINLKITVKYGGNNGKIDFLCVTLAHVKLNYNQKKELMLNSKSRGKSIRLFLVDGSPTGIITAEIMNWTGHVLSAPRTKLTELVQREEVGRSGIYFLSGYDTEDPDKNLVYIGESDQVKDRLIYHNRDEAKDFWERVCVITSKDTNLTKAHIRYLESRLIHIAKKSGRIELTNSIGHDYDRLPEADTADMEAFIHQIQLILPVLGYDFLKRQPIYDQGADDQSNDDILYEIDSSQLGLHATAKEIDGEFVVLEGSTCRREWTQGGDSGYASLFRSLYDQGKISLKSDGTVGEFNEDVAFSSPSAASAIIYGRSSNGLREWKVRGTKKSYADWQNERIS
jgi:hypothetical protein